MRRLECNSYSGFHEMVNYFEIFMENSPEEELNIEEEKEWSISSDGSALFFKEDYDTMKSFVKKMIEHEKFYYFYIF